MDILNRWCCRMQHQLKPFQRDCGNVSRGTGMSITSGLKCEPSQFCKDQAWGIHKSWYWCRCSSLWFLLSFSIQSFQRAHIEETLVAFYVIRMTNTFLVRGKVSSTPHWQIPNKLVHTYMPASYTRVIGNPIQYPTTIVQQRILFGGIITMFMTRCSSNASRCERHLCDKIWQLVTTAVILFHSSCVKKQARNHTSITWRNHSRQI